MHKITLKLFIVIFTISLPLSLFAEPLECSLAKHADFSKAIEKNQKLVQDYMEKKHIVGLSIAISICDQLIWSKGFGLADLENNVPVTPKTKFRIASVSKTLTATALAQLHEKELLHFDDEIHTYLPSFPEKIFPITPRQLAGHLAGIRHYKGDEFLMMESYPTVTDGLAIFQNDPLLHEPGSKFLYSSYGWNLLSAIIEKTSGMGFLDYMQENIFTPLNMKNTAADWNRKIISNRSRFYTVDKDGNVTNSPYVDNSYKWAGGGYLTNAEDLIIFGNAMLYDKLISRESFTMLTKAQKTTSGQSTHYGMGWSTDLLQKNLKQIEKDFGSEVAAETYARLKDQPMVGHSGGAVGGKTLFWILPKSGIVVAAISNSNIPPTIALNVTAEFVQNLEE